jgi:deoxycytidine triphosphate deaminase
MSQGKMIQSTRREQERERLRKLIAKRPKDDKDYPFTGVLLDDAIKACVAGFELISPLSNENLKPANYKLRIGDEYAVKGEIRRLSDEPGENQITIQPFDVAVIKTLETINMPRFLIARWNIRVQLAYQGLLWVGGPQVDAGYVGYLFCPIYNLSDKPVTLTYGDPIAVIDFVKTSHFNEGKSHDYPGLPERILFEDYNPQSLISGLVTHAKTKIDQFEPAIKSVEGRVDNFQGRVDNFVSLTLGVLAVLFAALAIFVTRPDTSPSWNPSMFLMSGLAIFLSMFAWLKSKQDGHKFGRVVQTIIVVLLLIGLGSQFYRLRNQGAEIQDLKRQMQELQANPSIHPESPPH